MRNKLGSYFILALAVNTVIFSTSTQAAVTRWTGFDLKLNDIGCGVDRGALNASGGTNKRLFCSLGAGYSKAKAYDAVLKYNNVGNSTFDLGGIKVKSGKSYHFNSVKYGSTQPISLYNAQGKLVDTYTLVFTNLPVVQIATTITLPTFVNAPKVQGTFRLMSTEFNQDTGIINMGAEYRGQTARLYPKLPYGIGLGTSSSNWKSGNKVKLLDMRTSDNWILDASYRDPTFARNIVSQDIFRSIHPKNAGIPTGQTSIKGHLVEAIVNNSYAGVFVLEEKVDRDLLAIKDVKGSVIYKADFNVNPKTPAGDVFYNSDAKYIKTNFSQPYPDAVTTDSMAPLQSFISFVAKSSDDDFINNIENRIDLNSLADWWLMVRATQANDNTSKNFFLAKNAGGKFFVVPWDNDASFGMFWDGSANPATTFFDVTDNNLLKRLSQFPETLFNAKLQERWAVLRQSTFTKEKLVARFSKYGSQLAAGGAKERNRALWPTTTVAPAKSDPKLGTAAYISAFLDIRLKAMDDYIKNLPNN